MTGIPAFSDVEIDRLAKHLAAAVGIEDDIIVYEGGPFEWTAWRDEAREYLEVAFTEKAAKV